MSENKTSRLLSLDVFRGMTIAGMVLVNNPGSWSAIYPPLEHAEWHGWTPTDMVFPFFVFIVGISITLALGKRVESGGVNREIYTKIFTRSALIFLLGLFLALFPFYNLGKSDWTNFSVLGIVISLQRIILIYLFAAALFIQMEWKIFRREIVIGALVLLLITLTSFYFLKGEMPDVSTVRILGVLQRLAICYFFGALIFVNTNWKQQVFMATALLLIYWGLMTLIDVPGCAATSFDDRACNMSAYIDRLILTENHIYKADKVFDPEGLLSTIPAIATCLAGILCGHWLRTKREDLDKVAGILFFGIVLVTIGWIWHAWFPINKKIWTSSYVVYMAGLALCFLGFCYWLIDIKGYKKWAKPFLIFGVNALALFVGSGVLGRLMGLVKFTGAEGKEVTLQGWIFNSLYLPFALPINASLMYALTYIGFWLFLMWLLYRKEIYIKI
jgi:predicted acyltransferase